ncbi:uracil phosphoribosyltransferase [Halolamina pelagica]|uniref:Uracil phosphoribosyltransferase n=1 Tax=Halolamina pelagica TaxID=699431 RepID=A0A0P7G7A9_9EURY|nr:uracil phosphoribosyltransferase [Halolamina pelagica]
MIDDLGVSEASLDDQIDRERAAAAAKVDRYRGDRPPLDVAGKRVVVVDDGVATGATTTACLRQLRNANAESVVLAVPVAPPDTVDRLQREADEVVCVEAPPQFQAVGQFYERFEQVVDEEAVTYLDEQTDAEE